ncbi:reticulon-4-interacting protein 1 homolog, mitochondrial-like [Diadema antillarum]|uniref:reticulon-4-interacting protein 1 homolog, mitochondrial-like n=1 Tax=Diadema antillarum TaxID=105358 RepID=UPI003A84EADD
MHIMPSVLVCCMLPITPCALVYVFPEQGVTLGGIFVSKSAWRLAMFGVALVGMYKVFFRKTNTNTKPKCIYFSSTKKMRAQIFREYGPSALELDPEHPRPEVVNPADVLVRVLAASVNPIDRRLKMGHARSAFDKQRAARQLPFGGAELPFVLGRDCSGIVEAVGTSVKKFSVGDEVYLSVGPGDTPGTFAEFVLAKEYMMARKPRILDHSSAASLPYVISTTWAALVDKCGLTPETTAGKRVLILAGTGGIGTFAIQLIKAWGGHVTTTCAANGVQLVERLGADDVIDYVSENLGEALSKRERFDVIFDTLGPAYFQLTQSALAARGRIVTIVVPFFLNLKKHGKFLGTLQNTFLILGWKMQEFFTGRRFTFSFNQPNGRALEEVAELIEEGEVKPVVQKEFPFEETNEALEFSAQGHARGKTVIVMAETENSN